MNNAIFWKTMENVWKHRDIKLITPERRKSYLVSKQNYHTTNKNNAQSTVFQLISWCEDFVERHSLHILLGKLS